MADQCSGPRSAPAGQGMPCRLGLALGLVFLAVVLSCVAPADAAQERTGEDSVLAARRKAMVDEQIRRRGIRDRRVLTALEQAPRHAFVPSSQRANAYDDTPLPIGYGQTISQPYIVAYMTETLQVDDTMKVLEIGTGSGYQAAVLSPLVRRVCTMEIIPELATAAAERLRRLGCNNVAVRTGDGYHGWPEEAPFDAIIVTAAAGHISPPLLAQLRAPGRMVIPVGGPFLVQNLVLVSRHRDGRIETKNLLPVRFVPLTGAGEDKRGP